MRYLITCKGNNPFYTEWFDSENHFNKDIDMVIYDLHTDKYTNDGEHWKKIVFDHL